MATQDECRRKIIDLWSRWEEKEGASAEYLFFMHLEAKHPDALDFSVRAGDKWQVVQAWLKGIT